MASTVIDTCVLCTMVTLLQLATTPQPLQALHSGGGCEDSGSGSSSGTKAGRKSLPDPSLLLLPDFLNRMQARKMIYRDTQPHFRWIVKRIDHSDKLDNYCPEVVYATLVLNRRPLVQYHRTCDRVRGQLWSHSPPPLPCRTAVPGHYLQSCQPHTAHTIVTIAGQERYQEVYTGCVCQVTVKIAN